MFVSLVEELNLTITMQLILNNVLGFIILLSIVVFIHEFGHYLIARVNGVHVEEFALGYGKAFFTKTDKLGTKWKICYLPFGGFCRFFGDEDGSSSLTNKEKLEKMSVEERKKCLYFKSPWQKICIVSAGPFFNYLLSIVCFCGFFLFYGKHVISNKITFVEKDSPAEKAGLEINDRIIKIENDSMENFEEIQYKIMLSTKNEILLKILRDGNVIEKNVQPKVIQKKDKFGTIMNQSYIGIASNDYSYKKIGFFRSLIEGFKQTYSVSKNNLVAFFQILTGQRSLDGIGGPIKIAQYSGEAFKNGLGSFIYFIAIISSSLAVMNLLPIPVLDGGHIFLYLLEVVRRGKKLSDRAENMLFKIGFSILLFLMSVAILKDFTGLFK